MSRREDFTKTYGRTPTKAELAVFIEYLDLVQQCRGSERLWLKQEGSCAATANTTRKPTATQTPTTTQNLYQQEAHKPKPAKDSS